MLPGSCCQNPPMLRKAGRRRRSRRQGFLHGWERAVSSSLKLFPFLPDSPANSAADPPSAKAPEEPHLGPSASPCSEAPVQPSPAGALLGAGNITKEGNRPDPGHTELMTESTGLGVMGAGSSPTAGPPGCITPASYCPSLGLSHHRELAGVYKGELFYSYLTGV